MTSTTTLSLVDGVKVVAPDSLNLITCYVLREQQDWFEDEIRFLRRLLQPGQKVIDVGANHGVYTLSMAKAVSPGGHVWAFEPASATARLLAEGIAANGFEHVTLEACALSSESGTLHLALNDSSELNALVRGPAASGLSEAVSVSTLDACLEQFGWRDIAFLKLDAEGEEVNILKGGQRFFAEQSPLVQYEIKAGAELHFELVDRFDALGYRSYRLVPGLDLLVPFNRRTDADPFLLNLFACKPDRAEALAAQGRLVQGPADEPEAPKAGALSGLWSRFTNRLAYDWQSVLGRRPYGRQLVGLWKRTMSGRDASPQLAEALSRYAMSRDPELPPERRLGALMASVARLRALTSGQSKGLRLASLARAAADLGARSLAVQSLTRLCDDVIQNKEVDLSEPFLVPAHRFDGLEPGASIGDWVMAAALEELERLGEHSSFFSGRTTLPRLDAIRTLGFASDEMKRRAVLIRQRFGLDAA